MPMPDTDNMAVSRDRAMPLDLLMPRHKSTPKLLTDLIIAYSHTEAQVHGHTRAQYENPGQLVTLAKVMFQPLSSFTCSPNAFQMSMAEQWPETPFWVKLEALRDISKSGPLSVMRYPPLGALIKYRHGSSGLPTPGSHGG